MQQRTEAPAAVEQAAPVVQTPPAPTPAPGGDFNPTQWLQARSEQERQAIDEYVAFSKKSLESELHGQKTEVGRLRKASDPVHAARLAKEEAIVGRMKAAAVSLYGVDAKDLEDIDTIDAFETAMRFIPKGQPKPVVKAEAPAGVDQSDWQGYLAYKAGQAPPSPARPPLAPANGGGYGPPAITTDNIDALYMDAERKGLNPNPYQAQYSKFLTTGQL